MSDFQATVEDLTKAGRETVAAWRNGEIDEKERDAKLLRIAKQLYEASEPFDGELALDEPDDEPQVYRHFPCRRVFYSGGVKEFCEENKCYWLLDVIATRQTTDNVRRGRATNPLFDRMQIWTMRRHGENGAMVEALADIPGDVIDSQRIPMTDWDFEEQGEPRFYVADTVVGGVAGVMVILPEEY